MLNWKALAASFVNGITRESDKHGKDLLPAGITLLRNLTGAYASMQVMFADKVTAKVKYTTPSFLDELVLNPAPIQELLKAYLNKPFAWPDIPAKQNVFQELLTALSSAVIIPVNFHQQSGVIVLGWSEPQHFDAGFAEGARIIKEALESALEQSSRTETLQRSNAYLSAILESLSQAVIFIDDNGYTGWVNKQAARLLKLPMSGELPPSEFAGALAAWRNAATNITDINQQAAAFFAKPGSAIKDWIWRFEQPEKVVYSVSCTPLKTVQFSGKVWVFDNVTLFFF
ncbi:PAS domain-containing protein [Filimonas lacunae]|uniref:PAS domain-containing protein n=1 Tax=Filimonas lacunae TaxID=477680 RepID=A0A173ML59_9BACT|nr:PAS domain-containing protein [Filimonas lacunae]BAV08382.1 two-component hybrid sensor and regulator [Filimonas lacunae]SIT33477.1 PAS domain-containing protein [Filimonas lacunae]